MPPRPAPVKPAPEAAPKAAQGATAPPPEQPPPPPAACPDFGFWYGLWRVQNRTNLSVLVTLGCVLLLLIIQDKEIQALKKGVRALQEAAREAL